MISIWHCQINKKGKSKFTYDGGGLAFDGEVSWHFGNDFNRNVVIFGVDDCSSSHIYDRQNIFLYQVKDRMIILMAALVQQIKKKIVLTFIKQKQNFA